MLQYIISERIDDKIGCTEDLAKEKKKYMLYVENVIKLAQEVIGV